MWLGGSSFKDDVVILVFDLPDFSNNFFHAILPISFSGFRRDKEKYREEMEKGNDGEGE